MTTNRSDQERAESCGRVIDVAPDGRIIWPWTRQRGESRQAYEAFVAYRDPPVRGARSIRRTACRLGKSRQLCERWSRRWKWIARCERFDLAVDRLRQARALAEITKGAAQAVRLMETARYLAVRGGRDDLARLLTDENFMLYAGLVLPLEDLARLVDADGPPLPGGWAERHLDITDTRERRDPSLGGGLDESTPAAERGYIGGSGNGVQQKGEKHDDRIS